MGHKNVCFGCRKAFNVPYEGIREIACTTCGTPMTQLPHRFRPPKKNEDAKWETAKFLVEQGFPYHHVYNRDGVIGNRDKPENYVDYPESMREAREFIVTYREQAKNKVSLFNDLANIHQQRRASSRRQTGPERHAP